MADTYRSRVSGGRHPAWSIAGVIWVAVLVLGLTLAGCGASTSADPERPVLRKLPSIALADVTEVRVNGEDPSSPIILSPEDDRELVERLLAAYEKTSLDPGAGFAQFDGFPFSFAIPCGSGREVSIFVPAKGDRVLVAYWSREDQYDSSVAGGVRPTPRAYGIAPELSALYRSVVRSHSGFTPGQPALPEEMPEDFSFILRYGLEGARNVLDTVAGTFTKDMIQAPDVTTDLRLSPEELRLIYGWMKEAGIQNYVGDFRPGGQQGGGTPSPMYRLELTVDGREREIEWDDTYGSLAPEAKALRELLQSIAQLIERREEYKKLPPAVGGYM